MPKLKLPFTDRRQAGRLLAEALQALPLPAPRVVLALPRGGVPVALPIALALQAPLDLLLVRKIGAPQQPELAVAAVVEGDPPQIVGDDALQRIAGADAAYVQAQARLELREIERQRQAYLGGRPSVPLTGASVIVVDDGIATGTTLRAALQALRQRGAARLVLAVPVAAQDTLAALRSEVDAVVCLATPQPFHAVGKHYRNFQPVSDAEVILALDTAAQAWDARAAGAVAPGSPQEKSMLKLLIAVDGSDHARRAIEAAARLTRQMAQVEAVLLNVGDGAVFYGELTPLDYEAVEQARKQAQQQLLQDALAHAQACGLKTVSALSALGTTADEIARVADEQGVDQIVMGTHGKGAIGSLFLGSTAQRVVHLAKVPVLLVK